MKSKKIDCVLLALFVFFSATLAVSFLLMPLGRETAAESLSLQSLLVGLLFWLSVLCITATQIILSYRRKKRCRIHRIRESQIKWHIGLFSFFKNVYAALADSLFFISAAGLAISAALTDGLAYSCYIFTAASAFFLLLHSLLNGKNFYCIMGFEKILKTVSNKQE